MLVPVEPGRPAPPVARRRVGARRPARPGHPGALACGSASPTPATTRPPTPPARPTTCWPRASGPGFNGPLVVAVELPDGAADCRRSPSVADAARHDTPASRSSPRRTTNPSGDAAVITRRSRPPRRRTRRPSTSSTTCATTSIPAVTRAPALDVHVGGVTAAGIDDSGTHPADRLPLFIGGVLLAVVPAADGRCSARSLVPLKAVDHEPAVDRRRLRRRRRRVPVGLGRRPHRRRPRRARSSRGCR